MSDTNDVVPRSRLDAVEIELQEAKAKLIKVQQDARGEIERLERELAERDAALVVMLSKLWDEFVDEVRKESGLYEQLNFLGSVAWHKACFDRALANLPESAKQAAKVIEAAREHYEIEREKEKKGHEGCDCGIYRAVRGMKE